VSGAAGAAAGAATGTAAGSGTGADAGTGSRRDGTARPRRRLPRGAEPIATSRRETDAGNTGRGAALLQKSECALGSEVWLTCARFRRGSEGGGSRLQLTPEPRRGRSGERCAAMGEGRARARERVGSAGEPESCAAGTSQARERRAMDGIVAARDCGSPHSRQLRNELRLKARLRRTGGVTIGGAAQLAARPCGGASFGA
jgi:hypothetical protein